MKLRSKSGIRMSKTNWSRHGNDSHGDRADMTTCGMHDPKERFGAFQAAAFLFADLFHVKISKIQKKVHINTKTYKKSVRATQALNVWEPVAVTSGNHCYYIIS